MGAIPTTLFQRTTTTDACLFPDDPLLLDMVETGYGLLDELRMRGVLSQQQVERVQSQRTKTGEVRQLLDEVTRMSREQQEEVLSALDSTCQSHVVAYIRYNGQRPAALDPNNNWPIYRYGEWERIQQNWGRLKDLIDLRNGLLDELLSVGCINGRQRQHIAELNGDAFRNELFLNIIRRRSVADYEKFIECLTKTKQHHVVSLLEPHRSTIEQPVSELHRSALTANYSTLVELMDSTQSGLTAKLFSAGVVTRRQREYVESAASPSESNGRLLDLMQGGSERNFAMFLDCLIKDGQQHVADILLLSDGAVAEIVAQTSLSLTDEDAVVERFFDLYRNTFPDRREQLRRDFYQITAVLGDCQLVAMRTKHSIKLFIVFKSLAGLLRLNELYLTKELETFVGQMFNVLSDTTKFVTVRSLKWNMSNYDKCVQRINGLSGLSVCSKLYELAGHSQDVATDDTVSGSLPVNRLPHELLECLLLKTAGHLFVALKKKVSRAQIHALTTLHAVCRYWWETSTYRPTNRELLRQYFKHVCAPYRFNPKLIATIRIHEGRSRTQGIAEINDKIYIVSSLSNVVKIFTIVGSSYRDLGDEIEVPDMVDPIDIVACGATDSLYISDFRARCIWRVNLSTSGEVKGVKKFTKTDYVPFTLSVQSARLIVTAYGGRTVHVYRCDDDDESVAEPATSVQYTLPDTILPLHAVEISDGTVIVCHNNRWFDGTDLEHGSGVSKLSADGRILRGHERSEDVLFNDPSYMTVNSRGHVAVCDELNRQIVHLNGELEWQHRLLTEQDLSGITNRLCYSETRGVLYVCYFDLSQVDVYRI